MTGLESLGDCVFRAIGHPKHASNMAMKWRLASGQTDEAMLSGYRLTVATM